MRRNLLEISLLVSATNSNLWQSQATHLYKNNKPNSNNNSQRMSLDWKASTYKVVTHFPTNFPLQPRSLEIIAAPATVRV